MIGHVVAGAVGGGAHGVAPVGTVAATRVLALKSWLSGSTGGVAYTLLAGTCMTFGMSRSLVTGPAATPLTDMIATLFMITSGSEGSTSLRLRTMLTPVPVELGVAVSTIIRPAAPNTKVTPTPSLVASAYPASATATASLSTQPSTDPAPPTTLASPLKRNAFSK